MSQLPAVARSMNSKTFALINDFWAQAEEFADKVQSPLSLAAIKSRYSFRSSSTPPRPRAAQTSQTYSRPRASSLPCNLRSYTCAAVDNGRA
eukprot:6348069-Karenia_brevis.AAC.1